MSTNVNLYTRVATAVCAVGLTLASLLPSPALAQSVPQPTRWCDLEQWLIGYWSDANGDNYTTANPDGKWAAINSGYKKVRYDSIVFGAQVPGSVALKTYWSSARGDNLTVSTDAGIKSALASGYVYARTEGYVSPVQWSGYIPLKLYWNPANQDNYTTASADGQQVALQSGYQFVRNEGYVPSGLSCVG
jgi:hypothetical protein